MSELIDNTGKRLKKLYEFTHRLVDGENGSMLIKQYSESIETVTATETMQIFDMQLVNGYNAKGEYKGTIEVSQDVTEIMALEGEQRLLGWVNN